MLASHDLNYLSFWHMATGQRLFSIGPWGSNSATWSLMPDGRTIYLTSYDNGTTSLRKLTLKGK